jgi:hypothetical protein
MNDNEITRLDPLKLKNIVTATHTEIVEELSPEQKGEKLFFIMGTIKKLFLLRGYDNKTDIIDEISNQLFEDGFKAKAIKLACDLLAKSDKGYLNYPTIVAKVIDVSGQIKETFYRAAYQKVQAEIQQYVNSHQCEIDKEAEEIPREDLLKSYIAVKEEQLTINKKYGDDPAYKAFKQALSKGLGYALDELVKEIQEFRKKENL